MTAKTPSPIKKRRRLYYLLLATLLAFLSWVALLLPLRSQLQPALLQPGQVADQDYLANESQTFISQVLTDQRRQEAENSILPVYSAPDTNVARRQSESLRVALAYINSVRADNFATPLQKISDLAALDNLRLDEDASLEILALNESRWQAVGQAASLA